MNNENNNLLKKKMQELIAILQKWDYEYYILNNPTVEDGVYDQKMQELKDLEAQSSIILDESPTNRMNTKIYKQSKFKLVRRTVPMLSIDNTNNKDGLLAFDKRVKKELKGTNPEYVCELKIDGLSASILYRNGKLFQVSTRGNGSLGEDVTFNKEVISNLPSEIINKNDCEVRGEIYMREEEFAQLNEEIIKRGAKKLANARNAAAGTLRTLIPNKERKLRFFAYQYFTDKIDTQEQCLGKLASDNFTVGEYRLCKNINEVSTYAEEIAKRRDKLGFSIDGIVVKVNSYEQHKLLGQTNKFPRWAIAYKFTPLSAISTVRNINTAVSKNGRITYVAEIEKVLIAGSTIANVTLHNFAFIERKKLNIGDEVLINKAGDVIPQVAEVLQSKSGRAWSAPANCQSCANLLDWEENRLYQICPNIDCQERNINYLVFFASKSAIDIKGVSKSIVERLFNLGLVKRPYDFYNLANKRAELTKVEMFKEKSINNLLDAIDRSRYKNIASFITAFSIPLLSLVKARKFTAIFENNIEKILAFIKSGSFETIKEELGEKTGASIELFFRNKSNLENVERTASQMIFVGI